MCAKCDVRDAANAGDWQTVHDLAAAQLEEHNPDLDDHDEPKAAGKGKHEEKDTDD